MILKSWCNGAKGTSLSVLLSPSTKKQRKSQCLQGFEAPNIAGEIGRGLAIPSN